MRDETFTNWRKSTRSSGDGNCVEVASSRRVVGVRDSKQHGHGPVLRFGAGQWDAFLAEAKHGGLNRR